ncbi:ribonuclease T2 [Patellaria atrata CBS 101060]|uniref:Ribonuclease T2-like n=1 Tax=Patellaria atrata CBS 101060 TaxID=1346257 RepID=A0A9P4SBB4_9PEZI|nr:ribonuclease T2 [Patellaria atrata CBS 101060]
MALPAQNLHEGRVLPNGAFEYLSRIASSLPSIQSFSKLAFGGAQVLLGSETQVPLGRSSGYSCPHPQLSCHNTSVVENTCCFNYPGGQMLQTQFWDTHPVTGPVDSWTVHGLWPDKCDGTYEANCDSSRAYGNISAILTSFNKTELVSYMRTYWKDYKGNDDDLWKHEWSKHGTCVSTLETKCFTDYTATEEVVDYFEKTIELFKKLPSYEWLASFDIVPSYTRTYDRRAIQEALSTHHGAPVTLGCRYGALQEIWYHYAVRGSLQSGMFVPELPDGMKSTCPQTGIRYLPKSHDRPGRPTGTTTTTGALPTGTGGAFEGRGILNVEMASGGEKGCIISKGTWYTGGRCATFKAEKKSRGDGSRNDDDDNERGFTLSSRRGKCGIAHSALVCGPGVSATRFTNKGGLLAVEGNTTFYAEEVPRHSVQEKVFTDERDQELGIRWKGV